MYLHSWLHLRNQTDTVALVLSNSFCSSYSNTLREIKSLLNVTTLNKTSSSIKITPVSMKVVKFHLIVALIYNFSLGCIRNNSQSVESKYDLLFILGFYELDIERWQKLIKMMFRATSLLGAKCILAVDLTKAPTLESSALQICYGG